MVHLFSVRLAKLQQPITGGRGASRNRGVNRRHLVQGHKREAFEKGAEAEGAKGCNAITGFHLFYAFY